MIEDLHFIDGESGAGGQGVGVPESSPVLSSCMSEPALEPSYPLPPVYQGEMVGWCCHISSPLLNLDSENAIFLGTGQHLVTSSKNVLATIFSTMLGYPKLVVFLGEMNIFLSDVDWNPFGLLS